MKSRMLSNIQEILDTADKAQECFVSMVDQEGMPYLVPMNFGLKDQDIYLHSAPNGRKVDALRNNPNVCICFTSDRHLRWQNEEVACSYGMKYRSVRAYGQVKFVEDYDKKVEALNCVMRKYTGKEFTYNAPSINEVLVWRVEVKHWEGRVYGY
ncbi:MAG TPA: pyridoxamine 5'-phosphate oxidase family protein [Bacteroidales bacterium]|nr:pyridoxamine 5'-phosphate oxidase family protein [Bacteroidales bacterium]